MVKRLHPAVRIADRLVGGGAPCFIIAEAGVNHNGEMELARRLVDAAADTGADAVKFQTFRTEALVTQEVATAGYQEENTGTANQRDLLASLELPFEAFRELASHAAKRKILFLSTPFDGESAGFLQELDLPAFKIASGEITNLPFLEQIARFGKPVILSTGMATLGEVERAVERIRAVGGGDRLILLHCVSDYPANPADVNLRAMETLAAAFGVPVGFSDHTEGIIIPIAAAALGACVVEKHFTLDRTLPGPDHRASLEPEELAEMIRGIRAAEKALGDGVKRPTARERETARAVRKRIVTQRAVARGEVFTLDALTTRRASIGLPSFQMEEVVGRRARRDLAAGEGVEWGDLE